MHKRSTTVVAMLVLTTVLANPRAFALLAVPSGAPVPSGTVSQLPTCNATSPGIAIVSDSISSCTPGAPLNGLGKNSCFVGCNGTNWVLLGTAAGSSSISLSAPADFSVGGSPGAALALSHSGQTCSAASCTVTSGEVTANAAANNVAVNLPVASGSYLPIEVCKADSSLNTVTLSPSGTDKISGAPSVVLSVQNQCARILDIAAGSWSLRAQNWSAIPSAALATTGVTAGSYTNANITVNAQGQITNASSGPTTTPTPIPIPSVCYGIACPGGPALPALTNPVVFGPGPRTYNGHTYTVDGTGATNVSAALQDAMTGHDVEVLPGLYYLAPVSLASGGSVNPPSGRNIRCCTDPAQNCSDTNPLDYNAQGGTVAFWSDRGSIGKTYQMFFYGAGNTGGSWIGCQFRGNNYNIASQPHNAWNGGPDGTGQGVFYINGGGGRLFAYNDFNGIGGNSGALNFASGHAPANPQGGTVGSPNGDIVEWNSFEHCGTNSWILDTLDNNNQFLHNKVSDCSPDIEPFSGPSEPMPTGNVMAYNDIHWVYGQGNCYPSSGGNPNGPYCDYVDWGASCPNCTSNQTDDYSGNLTEYNYLKDDSAGQFGVGLNIGCLNTTSGDCPGYSGGYIVGSTIPARFISNKCDTGTNCTIWHPHGHNYVPSSNSSYPASDTSKSNQ